MSVLWTRARQGLACAPSRLYRALPSVLLGILLNTLDTMSTGLLVFPTPEGSHDSFSDLQVQAMSMYLMSTLTSQLVMTLGGSLFPGALGSMLIEILPFLRGIATAIQNRLGQGHPAVLPTVMAAYALTSFLVGGVFIILGALRCGKLVEYFPKTVLTGAIGAIGLSLFLLGLGLTLPSSSGTLSLSTAGRLLFSSSHIPLLIASVVPALFLTISVRSALLARLTRGFTGHAMYVPVYVISITGIFWIVVAATGYATKTGMDELSSVGWLFSVNESVRNQSGIGNAWNYWALFNFRLVEWTALSAAVENIVLLVVIGVLNLPIYVPAMALALDIPKYSMDHELLGHGAMHILAGVVGTIPNLVVFSNSLFFTRAGGGRFEGCIVIVFTGVLLVISSLMLPYVPTILASILVVFLGFELMTAAVWESASELCWPEYAIVIGTLVSCTFVGFAPGFGIGVGLSLVVHFGYSFIDSRPRRFGYADMDTSHLELQPNRFRGSHLAVHRNPVGASDECIKVTGDTESGQMMDSAQSVDKEREVIQKDDFNISIIEVKGYAFFAMIPSLEREMDVKVAHRFIILDLRQVHRIETSVAQFIARKMRELRAREPPVDTILAGVTVGSGVQADLTRGGVECRWDSSCADTDVVLVFKDLRDAMHHYDQFLGKDDHPTNDVPAMFSKLFPATYRSVVYECVGQEAALGITYKRYSIGQDLQTASVKFIAQGKLALSTRGEVSDEISTPPVQRPSLVTFISKAPRHIVQWVHRKFRAIPVAHGGRKRLSRTVTLFPGDFYGFGVGASEFPRAVVLEEPCCVFEVDPKNAAGIAWAHRVAVALVEEKASIFLLDKEKPLSTERPM